MFSSYEDWNRTCRKGSTNILELYDCWTYWFILDTWLIYNRTSPFWKFFVTYNKQNKDCFMMILNKNKTGHSLLLANRKHLRSTKSISLLPFIKTSTCKQKSRFYCTNQRSPLHVGPNSNQIGVLSCHTIPCLLTKLTSTSFCLSSSSSESITIDSPFVFPLSAYFRARFLSSQLQIVVQMGRIWPSAVGAKTVITPPSGAKQISLPVLSW